LTPSPALLIADLTPALGRQNDTTSPSASARFVKRALPASTASRPTLVTCATPLFRDGTGRLSELICLRCEAKYFCKRGWTGHFGKHEVICPSGTISKTHKHVITGLDPVIHLLRKSLSKLDGCPDQVRA
jgi:hypothetical protein